MEQDFNFETHELSIQQRLKTPSNSQVYFLTYMTPKFTKFYSHLFCKTFKLWDFNRIAQ